MDDAYIHFKLSWPRRTKSRYREIILTWLCLALGKGQGHTVGYYEADDISAWEL